LKYTTLTTILVICTGQHQIKYVCVPWINELITRESDIVQDPVPDIHSYIIDFDGIIMVDVTPPSNMYHPLLPFYDSLKKKCLFSCLPITGATFPSPILKVAIKHGYVVTKIYRADRYRLLPSKWRGLLGALYKIKYYSSKNSLDMTSHEKSAHLKRCCEEFDIDLDFDLCEKRPALKKSSKVLINSPWGKHAESVDHMQSAVIASNDYHKFDEFYNQIEKGHIEVAQFQYIADDRARSRGSVCAF
jgi:hypothetical protein